jgi:hypothetical protein
MTRPAAVSPSSISDDVAYRVHCGGSSKEHVFHELRPAMRYARKHNIKHHHGAAPEYHEVNEPLDGGRAKSDEKNL